MTSAFNSRCNKSGRKLVARMLEIGLRRPSTEETKNQQKRNWICQPDHHLSVRGCALAQPESHTHAPLRTLHVRIGWWYGRCGSRGAGNPSPREGSAR